MRIVKKPDIRRAEIILVANQLFLTNGYSETSVAEIVKHSGIAKGTFYHYFESKQAILEELTHQLVVDMAIYSEQIAQDKSLNAIQKLVNIINVQNTQKDDKKHAIDGIHLPENRELHERINIETIHIFGPILANVIEQGNHEGLFQVDDPLSTVQFILAGSQFLFGDGIFNWDHEEKQARMQAMFILIERTLAAKSGSLIAVLTDCINKGVTNEKSKNRKIC